MELFTLNVNAQTLQEKWNQADIYSKFQITDSLYQLVDIGKVKVIQTNTLGQTPLMDYREDMIVITSFFDDKGKRILYIKSI